MKTHIYAVAGYALLALLIAQTGYGQITIQETDVAQFWVANTTIKLYSDTSRYVNVGKTGGSNVYDFSTLGFPDSEKYTLYPSSQIPQLAVRFNPSSLVWGASIQSIVSSPVYQFTDTSFSELASVSIYPDSQMYTYEMIPLLQFPASYNLQWSRPSGVASEIFDSTYVHNTLTYLSTVNGGPKNYTVDGYGTLMVKGQSYQCLRVKELDSASTDYYRFSYFTKEGVSIFIDSDQNQSDTGRVKVVDVYFLHATGVATLVSNKEPTPENFSIMQNYPNPFNPLTVINYEIPQLSNVTLVIYDILGRQVESLVNEEKAPGKYQATFDASGLPSGVYFYRLSAGSLTGQAGTFTQVKKMILMK